MQERIEGHVLSTQQCLDEAATEQARAMTALATATMTHIQAINVAAMQRERALEDELRLVKRRSDDFRRRQRELAENRSQGRLRFSRKFARIRNERRATTNRADVAEQSVAELRN